MSRDPITISLSGEPRGKQRARFARLGNGRTIAFTPEQTRRYEGAIKAAAAAEMGARPMFDGAVRLELRAVFAPPASSSKLKRELMITNRIAMTKKVDLDNVIKAWSDAMNGVVYLDDRQIVQIVASKTYGPESLVVVTVSGI